MAAMRSTSFAAVGGAVGAAVRWAVGETMPATDGFPWPTLLVNLVGCLLVGVAASRLARDTDAWYGLVTGVLGGLTTFSAVAVETRTLLADGRAGPALVYVVASFVGGVVAVEVARGARRPAP